MKEIVYLGGFASSRRSVEYVADAIEEYYERDVEALPFADAMKDPRYVASMVREKFVVTHSAGVLALAEASPYDLTAVAPPLPTSRRRLIGKAAMKALRADGILCRNQEERRAAHVGVEQVAAISRRPIGNIRHIGRIAAFDAGRDIKTEGGARLAFMRNDDFGFYIPDNLEGEPNVRIVELEGNHDRLLVDPQRTLQLLDELTGFSERRGQ